MKFECDKCGLCCIDIGGHEETKKMHNGDGVCIHFDREKMLCRIYENRPIFCRVDDYFEQFVEGKQSREEYYQNNYEACEAKKLAWSKNSGNGQKSS